MQSDIKWPLILVKKWKTLQLLQTQTDLTWAGPEWKKVPWRKLELREWIAKFLNN